VDVEHLGNINTLVVGDMIEGLACLNHSGQVNQSSKPNSIINANSKREFEEKGITHRLYDLG